MGLNLESLELAATIRSEYPKVKLEIIDCNIKSYLKKTYGSEVNKALLNYYKNRGIDFKTGTGYASFQSDPQNQKNVKALKTKDGKLHEADAFVMFPNLYMANTDFIDREGVWEDSRTTTEGKLWCESDATVGNKVLFGAGSCVGHTDTITNQRYLFSSHFREAINTSKIAAFNILGLAIPLYTVPFGYTRHFTKSLQYVGNTQPYDDVKIMGSLENLDFIALYLRKGNIISA